MEINQFSTKLRFFSSPYVLEGPLILLREKVIGLTRWGVWKILCGMQPLAFMNP